MKFFNISKRKQKGHKIEDPFAQKINTEKAEGGKVKNPKDKHNQTNILVITQK